MKRRRIEITVSRRRSTIHLRNNLAAATAERTLPQADALHTVTTNSSPTERAELNQPQSTAADGSTPTEGVFNDFHS